MKLQTFLPLITYPDSNSKAVAANAACVAALLDADLTVQAVNVHIQKVSSPLSKLLLDVPEMIRKSEADSRNRGEKLLAEIPGSRQAGGFRGCEPVHAPIAELGETAAASARYYDLSLVGWEAGNPTSRMTAEAVSSAPGARRCSCLNSPVKSLEYVVIAWDGSRVAARAAADALPFLRRSSQIIVLTVVGENRSYKTALASGWRLGCANVACRQNRERSRPRIALSV